MMRNPITFPEDERDATGLTDRAYLDVLGLCISTGIVLWLVYELGLALGDGPSTLVAFVAFIAGMFYFAMWLEELLRQTMIYAGTWRYGVTA
ncbi:hypothetical protein [Halorubrum sp. F4]|uniref:hypothetical protein n=1 Tax=Halorubrum sp. F4 TaxID=2989715 RepID=UPI0024814D41|nr:hypothetical protein [Halorubrum sp. F4]